MTRQFKFALQAVLDHRRRIEEERQGELAAAKRELNEQMALLSSLHSDFRSHSNKLRDDHQAFGLEELRLHYAHLEYLDRAINDQEAVVAQKKAEHEAARQRLVEAAKEKKALEKLRDRRRDQHVLQEALIEQRETDDINARRFARSSAGGQP